MDRTSRNGRAGYAPGWEDHAKDLMDLRRGEPDAGARIRLVSDALLGSPYVVTPLIGGPDEPERLVIDLAAFDCVTLVETVLALARSRSKSGFVAELKSARYLAARVDWRSRLHYFSDWLMANDRRGAVRIRTRGPGALVIDKELCMLADLPPRRARLCVVPKKSLHLARPRLSNGSIIAFASVRKRIDYFHTGLVFTRDGQGAPEPEPVLYHASRSQGAVVREPLADFLKRNRMRGVSFAEPLAPKR